MTHRYTLTARPTSPAPSGALTELLHRSLASVPGVTITLTPLTSGIERYTDKLSRLSATLSLVARDFDAVTPYGRELAQLKKKSAFTAEDVRRVERLERFAERIPMLARIRRFLIDLPDEPPYEMLRVRQSLVLASLDLPRLIDEPAKLDGQVLQAFEEYHAEYVQLYLAMLARRERAIAAWQAQMPDIDRILDILTSLDAIPALGSPTASRLRAEYAQITQNHRSLGIPAKELRRILTVEPTVAGLTLFTPEVDRTLETYVTRVEAALREKLTVICETSVAHTLAQSHEPSVQKLAKLLSLTHLERITKLFTKNTTPKIIAELTTILGTVTPTPLHLTEFTPSITHITTQSDIDNIVSEFRTFLEHTQNKNPKNY